MSTSWVTVRIFISSTFRDMQAERDYLVRFVFPRLRQRLLAARIHFVDVDLRWGVTSEQDAHDVCREVIEECRPRFLCLLGGRYGTIPPGKGRSLTAEEVYFGVLDRAVEDRGLPYFYFREEAATAAMPEATLGQFREPPESGRWAKLDQLKRAVRDAGLHTWDYPALWDDDSGRLVGLKEFGDHVHRAIQAGIEKDPLLGHRFAPVGQAPPDEFAEEEAAVEAFVETCTQRFVLGSRHTVLTELLEHTHCTEGNGYLCLTGPPGSGKSAMLAHLSTHPAVGGDSTTLLIRHFAGASSGSTDIRRTLRRLCQILKAGCADITADVPEGPEELRDTFWEFLRTASTAYRVVVLVDGVNQLDLRPPFSGFHWLPKSPPPNVRIILSTPPAAVLDDLRRTVLSSELALPPLTTSDGETIVEQFGRRYGKTFESAQTQTLLAKADAGNPLYLLAALEELRTLGTFEEISDRIAELPDTATELFSWILRRLGEDDGFRDAAGQRVGRKLVTRFASLLGASRHGLSQRELTDLLAPGDPEGNVAALVYLLRPYLMLRGELLDFYHDQFREAATAADPDAGSRRVAAHEQLAEYFRRAATSEKTNHWSHDSRALSELPFHLAEAARDEKLRELFSELAFLAARVACGQIYQQLGDFSLAGTPAPQNVAAWQAFLQKHAQRLAEHPATLVALVNHEGFQGARSEVAQFTWSLPWLQTSAEAMPPLAAARPAALHAQVSSAVQFSWRRLSALAYRRNIAFCLEQLGMIRLFDLREMRPTDTLLSIEADRPLVFACAPDGSSLLVFYETGEAGLYDCVQGPDRRPTRLELVAEFEFLLPETEDPVVVWRAGEYWYQPRVDSLASVSTQRPWPSEESLPASQQGELSELVFVGGVPIVAMQQGQDLSMFAQETASLRRQSVYLASACSCGPKRIAAAFTDGDLIVFDSDSLNAIARVSTSIPRGELGWNGTHLVWLSESGAFQSWCPGDDAPGPVEDNQEIFPADLHVVPQEWILRPDATLLLRTTHSIVSLRLAREGLAADGRIDSLFGGPTWRAVRQRDKDQWLLERQRPEEVLLGRQVMGRLYCAQDGEGRFYGASGYGPGLLYERATLEATPLKQCPVGLNGAVGEETGGCWLTDRAGDIYFADERGHCRRVVEIGLRDVHGASLESCGEHLLWTGYSSRYFQDTGAEPARTLVVFRKLRTGPIALRKVGEQLRHPRDGLCITARYDPAAKRLVSLWVLASDAGETLLLRVGTVTGFARWEFAETPLVGLRPLTVAVADLSADGRLLGVVNRGGELSCVAVADGRVLATLAGSLPMTAIAPGPSGPSFWVIEARARVFGCTLVEGEAS